MLTMLFLDSLSSGSSVAEALYGSAVYGHKGRISELRN